MVDREPVIDRSGEVNEAAGTRFELFAIEDDSYDGGYFYRFQYYHPEEGHILRYDDSNDAHGVGPHHRHCYDEVTGLDFQGLQNHVERFTNEVKELDAQR